MSMWDTATREAFAACIADLIDDPEVQSMEQISQHVHGVSCLDHCVFVAYVSFALCRRLGLDAAAAARAGLLHDFYLCDWNDTDIGLWKRLLVHPRMALQNAARFELSPLECDIILKHMWPVTLRYVPLHRESVVVNLADKFCTAVELLHLYRASRAGNALLRFNRRRRAAIAFNR